MWHQNLGDQGHYIVGEIPWRGGSILSDVFNRLSTGDHWGDRILINEPVDGQLIDRLTDFVWKLADFGGDGEVGVKRVPVEFRVSGAGIVFVEVVGRSKRFGQ